MDAPIGVNKLQSVVKDLCAAAGLKGYYTNHSLWATCAMRMYNKGVDEQLISEFMGHQSLAICGYKKTSASQKRKASSIINQPHHYPCHTEDEMVRKGFKFV